MGKGEEKIVSKRSKKSGPSKASDTFFINVKDLDDFDKVDYKMYLDTLDIRKSNEYYNRVVCVEYCSVFLTFFGAALCIIQNELSTNYEIDTVLH